MLRRLLAVSVGWLGLSMVADGVPALLLPHLLLTEGDTDATRLGLITLVAIAVAALIQPAAGWVSDRVGRMPVIGVGTAMAVTGLLLVLAPSGAVAGTVVALAGVSVAQAGQQALLPDRIGAGWRGRAGGLKGAFDVAGAFAAFLILAALLGAGQTVLASGVLAAALIVGAAATTVLVSSSPPPRHLLPKPGTPRDTAGLASLVVARFLFLLGIYSVGRFLLLFVADRFDLGANAAGAEAGWILAVLALVTIGASMPGGWLADRIGRKPVMVGSAAIGALGIAALPAAPSLEAVVACGCLMAVASAGFGSASWAMLGDLTAVGGAGRLMGLANLGTAGAAAAAGLFGFVIDGAGFGAAFALAAACSLAGGVVAWALRGAPRHAGQLIGSTEGAH